MQQKLQKWIAASVISLSCLGTLQAQTVATFENVLLPGTDTGFLETKYPNSGTYTFPSGNALFYGNVSSSQWGDSWGEFNCSNATDTVATDYSAAAAAIVGSGYNNSTNYAIAFVPTDYMGPVPSATIPVGAKLTNTAVAKRVAGLYYTNSVFAYRYMLLNNTYATNHYFFKLVMRGYLNGTKSADSVVVTLADFTGTNTTIVNTWKWANLTSLGNVDSLTFDLISNDTVGGFGLNTPAYFAIDNLTTLDGVCPQATTLAAGAITENGATITWVDAIPGAVTNYQVAVDQSATLAPTATATNATTNSYAATTLLANTQYYAHVRAACPDGGFSDWDTAIFKTLQSTAIKNIGNNNLNVLISPNPAQNFIRIDAQTEVSASIYNLEGKLIGTHKNAQQIDISALSAGTYIIRITAVNDESQRATLRFIKNH